MAQKPSIPKGTRDFSPEEMMRRTYIFDTIKSVFRLFGYAPLETPSMENLSTLLGKYGDEGDKLLFKILNSGDYGAKLTDEELRKQQTLISEVNAKMSEAILGNEQFINKLVREDAPLAGKIIDKIKSLIEMLKNIGNSAATAEHRRLVEAEKLYLKAAEAAGNRELIAKILDKKAEDEKKKVAEAQQTSEDGVTEHASSDNFTEDAKPDQNDKKTPLTSINNENMHVSEDVVHFSKDAYDPETAGIKDQIRNASEKLNSMETVYTGMVPTHFENRLQSKKWAVEELKKRGFKAERQNFGTIEFSEKDIYGAIDHLDTDAERVSIAALYHVLKRGILIGEHGNHKLREKHTVTFAAPVELNGVRGNMAAVVNMRNKKYYVHRIIMPDGSSFKFNKNENANQEAQRGVPERSLANATRSASNNSIPDSPEKVNTSDEKIQFSREVSDVNPANARKKNPSIADIEHRKAEFEKLRVYEKADAEIIINNILSSVLPADDNVFSQLENKNRKQAENILYDTLNRASTDAEKTKAASDLADYIIMHSVVKDYVNEQEKSAVRQDYQTVIAYLGGLRNTLNLDGILEAISKILRTVSGILTSRPAAALILSTFR